MTHEISKLWEIVATNWDEVAAQLWINVKLGEQA
jgi:hypothetical protein